MARILLVKPSFPYPPNQGTRRVSLALVRDLATAHDVVYLCQRESRAETALIPHIAALGARVVAPLMPNRRSAFLRAAYKAQNLLKSRILRVPPISLYWSNRAIRGELARLEREFKPDAVILESWETYPLCSSIRSARASASGRPARAVLLAHDAAFQIRERAAAAATDEREKARRLRRFRREKELELRAWTMFEAILALTEDDKRTIEESLALRLGAGTTATDQRRETAGRSATALSDVVTAGRPGHIQLPRVLHLPMPVADEFFSYRRPGQPGHRIGFLGTFRADFNIDALAHLVHDLWPAIAARMPDAQLVVAGNGYEGRLKAEVQRIGGVWLGFVEDLGRYFESIDVLLVPLRFGAGLRIRILEALAAAAPIVASPIAAAGLAIADGEHYLSASGADEVSRAVARLLSDPAAAKALGERGRAWCSAHHSVAALRPRRLAVIDQILKSEVVS